jgi:superfamily I DNA/RNA helicase
MRETVPDRLPPMLSPSTPFRDEELGQFRAALETLSNAERVEYRDNNARAIASSPEAHVLIVAGPGTGKSHLFMDRIRYWLEAFPGERIWVLSFVRKLVRDLEAEIETSDLRPAEKALINVSTLHHLARSLVERNRGSASLPMSRYIKIIDHYWKEVVWRDVLGFHADAGDALTRELDRQFHEVDLAEEEPWPSLRETYFALCHFYNAVGFADVIRHAAEAVAENEDLIAHRLWIVDEFQDFNRAEEELIAACIQGADGELMAGDDDQALYQEMKSGYPAIIRVRYMDGMSTKAMLPYSSRCSQHICLGAMAFLERHQDPNSIRKVFLPLVIDESAALMRVVWCSRQQTAARYVQSFMEENADAISKRREEIVSGDSKDPFLLILAAARDIRPLLGESAEELIAAVDAWRIEEVGPGADSFLVLTYFRHSRFPQDNLTLRKIFHYENVSDEVVHTLLSDALDQNGSLSSLEHDATRTAREKSQAVASILEEDREPSDKARELSAVIAVEDLARLATDLDAFGTEGSRPELEGEEVRTAGGISPVEILTMVGAKGLSADHVMILGFDPVNMGLATPQLFFVAMTRARQSLHFVTAHRARGAEEPHPFLHDIPSEHCEHLKVMSAGEEAFEGRQALLDYVARLPRFRRRS